jgi:hypothetical protein
MKQQKYLYLEVLIFENIGNYIRKSNCKAAWNMGLKML